MPRSGDRARARLEEAALQLYAEQGYDQTTTAQIAERAGVTVRTYFRHFADKREVVFARESEVRQAATKAMTEVPADHSPLAAVIAAFRARIPELEAHREFSMRRHQVIAATPALREREAAKFARMVPDMADGLVARGVERPQAELFARVVTEVQAVVITSWLNDSESDLDELITAAYGDLITFFHG